MFKLVIGLFMATAAPGDPPVHIMAYNQSSFPTEEECRGFLDTDEGKAAAGSIIMMAHGRGLAVKFSCIEAKDNTI